MSEGAKSEASASGSGREMAVWSLVIFGVALALRGLELWELSSVHLFGLRLGDGRVYHLWAQGIADGDWVGDQVFYQAPFYPYFMAVVYAISDESQLILRLVQILIGATGCALLTQAGWRFFSKPVGILAGLALALYPPALFADVAIQKSVLDVFFVCAMLAIVSDIALGSSPRWASLLGLGVVLGALVLTRENALVFVVVLAAWLLARTGQPARSRLARTSVFVAGVAIVLLPVGIRNWSVSGDFHLTTSQFGHNFFIGNNPAADGTYAPLVYARGEPLVERDDAVLLASRALGHDPTPAEVSSFYTDRALDYITSEPLDWIALLGRKAMLAINSVELVDTYGHYTFAEYSIVLRAPEPVLHFGILVPLAFLGFWITWPRRSALWPLYALVASYAGTLLLFYIFGRYRLPLVPMLLMFSGAGVVGARDFLRSASRAQIVACLALTAGVAVLANWPILDRDYMSSVTRYNLGNELADVGLEDHAIEQYERAITLHADNALANHNLGVMLAMKKSYGVAQRHFERALEIAPDYAEAHFNLARVLVDSYEREAAIASYRRGIEIDPWRPEIHVELGRVLVAEGQPDAARESFGRALELDAGNADARVGLEALQGS